MTDTPTTPSSNPTVNAAVTQATPKTSESMTAQKVIELFRQAAASVGTGNTSEVMFALIEANATGTTPTKLLEGFTEDQRAAFDRALRQLNMGQGVSVMAQDILNTKVQINGVVTSYEAAVQELISSYAGSGGPADPKNQAEFQKKYEELTTKATEQISKLGENHTSTQNSLVEGVQKGTTPNVPATMAPTSSDPTQASVPGMPDNSLGSVLQNVAGQMVKPQNLPMPNIQQLAQPAAQTGQQVIQELMKAKGGEGGVPVTSDALKKLSTTAGLSNQKDSLSGPGAPGGPGEKDGPGAGGPGARTAGLGGGSDSERGGGGRHAAPLTQSGSDGQNPSGSPQEGEKVGPDGKPLPPHPNGAPAAPGSPGTPGAGESGPPAHPASTSPTAPATTAAPSGGAPTTTLSSASGDSTGAAALSSPGSAGAQTHTSAGDADTNATTLSAGGAGTGGATLAAASPGGGAAPMAGGMMPMMPMSPMGGMGAGAGGTRSGASPAEDRAKTISFRPDMSVTPDEVFSDFGAGLKGLDHGTDMQHIAAAILAGLVRGHRGSGDMPKIAVGISRSQLVLVTSDGLGFLAAGVKAPEGANPLIALVPESFVARWIGCAQPHRPLFEAAQLGLIAPLDSVVSNDPSSASEGVLVLDDDDIARVNTTPGTKPRENFDAIEEEDVEEVMDMLLDSWGWPELSADELIEQVIHQRWMGDAGPEQYLKVWRRYLLASALADIQSGDMGSVRYALRNALRVPVTAGVAA